MIDWLREQRWFRSKQRPIASVTEIDRAPIPGSTAALVVLGVTYRDGDALDRYLVPMTGEREPADGEGAWQSLVRAMDAETELPGTAGRFFATRTPSMDELLAGDLTERRLGVEQSNTSIRIGDRLILKLYRLLERGENPDLEVSAFLTEVGFADTPAVAGSLTYLDADAEPAAAAMLQAYVPSTGDAWATMLDALADDPERATRLAGELGTLTARMHAALASRPDDSFFPTRVADPAETAAWRASAEQQLAQAVTSVSGQAHDRLIELAPAVRARFADAFGSASGGATVQRIHGDYHLGQLLARTNGGFSVIDFEGEPARSLEERRGPSSPLRDVAGMLRSLDYAARTAEHSGGLSAQAWLIAARRAFLDACGELDPRLLAAFELEKACYEIRYEAAMRPNWLWLPMSALDRLVA